MSATNRSGRVCVHDRPPPRSPHLRSTRQAALKFPRRRRSWQLPAREFRHIGCRLGKVFLRDVGPGLFRCLGSLGSHNARDISVRDFIQCSSNVTFRSGLEASSDRFSISTPASARASAVRALVTVPVTFSTTISLIGSSDLPAMSESGTNVTVPFTTTNSWPAATSGLAPRFRLGNQTFAQLRRRTVVDLPIRAQNLALLKVRADAVIGNVKMATARKTEYMIVILRIPHYSIRSPPP